MPRKFNRMRAAAALVEAMLKSDKEVALVYSVSIRTIEYWRHRLKTDSELQQEFKKMAQEKFKQWVSEIPDSLELAIGFIASAARTGDTRDPKMVEAITNAIATLNDVLIVQAALEKREAV